MTEPSDHRNGVVARVDADAAAGADAAADAAADADDCAGVDVGGGEVRLLYCHCKYAKVIDPDVKTAVLAGLTAADVGFEAVADLCEMSARKDPSLARLAAPGKARIAACFPRAVKWLFHAAGNPIDENDVEVLNMREHSADQVLAALLSKERG